MNYLQLTDEQRRDGASKARSRLQVHLSNPTLSPEQTQALQGQINKIDQWEACRLPTNHVVSIDENLNVEEI
jgi:hypothetical protein